MTESGRQSFVFPETVDGRCSLVDLQLVHLFYPVTSRSLSTEPSFSSRLSNKARATVFKASVTKKKILHFDSSEASSYFRCSLASICVPSALIPHIKINSGAWIFQARFVSLQRKAFSTNPVTNVCRRPIFQSVPATKRTDEDQYLVPGR